MAPGSLALKIFRRGSLNHSIHCANQMIHWTAWSNFLSYMTQVIKAFTWNFFQAILLPINQSSIRLVTSVLYETIFTKYSQQRKPRNLIFNKKIKKVSAKKKKLYSYRDNIYRTKSVRSWHHDPVSAADNGLLCWVQSLPSLQAPRPWNVLKLWQTHNYKEVPS